MILLRSRASGARVKTNEHVMPWGAMRRGDSRACGAKLVVERVPGSRRPLNTRVAAHEPPAFPTTAPQRALSPAVHRALRIVADDPYLSPHIVRKRQRRGRRPLGRDYR